MKLRSLIKISPATQAVMFTILAVTSFQCIKLPLEPIMPASDIQMSIPLIDRTRTVADLMGKDTSKVKLSGTGYFYQDDRTFNPTQISPMTLNPQPLSNQVSLGTITVPGVTLPTQTASYPGPIGIPLLLPASSLTLPGATVDNSATIRFVVIKNGTVSLKIVNTLPVGISFPQSITLKNNKSTLPVDTSVIATFPFAPIGLRDSSTLTVSLAGKTLWGQLKTDPVTINTDASSGPVTINSGDGVSFGFSTTALSTDSVAAVIPNQSLASFNDSVITIDPTQVLQQATFSQGQFSLSINNQTGLTVGARLKFNNFQSTKPNHDTLIIDKVILPLTSYTLNVRLDTIQILNGDLSRPGTTMKFTVAIRTVSSGGAFPPSTITNNDFVSSSFTPQQTFAIKSLTGTINPITLPINTGVNLAGLGQASKSFTGSFSFDSIQMKLKLGLSGGFPVYHHLTLYAHKNSSGTTDSLPITPGTVIPSLSTPGVITLENAQGLSAFLGQTTSSFPDTMYVRGYVVVDSGRVSGTIYDTTKVYPSMSTIIPLKLGLLGGQYVDVAPIKGKFDSAFVASTKGGTLYLSITNGLPMKLNFRAAFLGDTTRNHSKRDTLLWLPQPGGATTYTINGADVDLVSGNVSGAVTSSFPVSIVTQEIKNISSSDSVYINLSLSTSGTNTPTTPQPVRIRATDFITIRASVSMVYTVNKK